MKIYIYKMTSVNSDKNLKEKAIQKYAKNSTYGVISKTNKKMKIF